MTERPENQSRNGVGRPLRRRDLAPDPIEQFARWFNEANSAEPVLPNAMTLATATRNGNPSARVVLLKDFDERGFVFYTNYGSRKGMELEENPRAALVFFWDRLDRQVRISGKVARVSREESAAYFQTRPLGSQLSAVVSRQSRPIPDREELEKAVEELKAELSGHRPPLPEDWGGYRLEPTEIEFWQGRADRLHDRFRYRCAEDGIWRIERLAP